MLSVLHEYDAHLADIFSFSYLAEWNTTRQRPNKKPTTLNSYLRQSYVFKEYFHLKLPNLCFINPCKTILRNNLNKLWFILYFAKLFLYFNILNNFLCFFEYFCISETFIKLFKWKFSKFPHYKCILRETKTFAMECDTNCRAGTDEDIHWSNEENHHMDQKVLKQENGIIATNGVSRRLDFETEEDEDQLIVRTTVSLENTPKYVASPMSTHENEIMGNSVIVEEAKLDDSDRKDLINEAVVACVQVEEEATADISQMNGCIKPNETDVNNVYIDIIKDNDLNLQPVESQDKCPSKKDMDKKDDLSKESERKNHQSDRHRHKSSHSHSKSRDEKHRSSHSSKVDHSKSKSVEKNKHESSSKADRNSHRHDSKSHKSDEKYHSKHDKHHSSTSSKRRSDSKSKKKKFQNVRIQCNPSDIIFSTESGSSSDQPFTRVPWFAHPQIANLKYGKYYRIEIDRNGGASIAHLYMDEISHLSKEQIDECAIEFIKLSYDEDEQENAYHVMGIVHGAASYLPDLVDYMADHYPSLIVKTGSLLSRDNHTTTMSEYRDEVYKTYSNGTFRYPPLDQLSICGVLGEEVGAYFPDFVARLEESPFMKPVMPWSCLSVVNTGNPRESNDGPIFWVRPGEQMLPANEALESARPKRRRNNELDKLVYSGARLTEARESLFPDRTKAHADQIGVDFGETSTAPTAAVGVLKAVNCGHPEHGNRATKDVIAFHAGDYKTLLDILVLDLYEPPQTQCSKWIEVSKLNTLTREGVRYAHVQLHDNDVYYLPRKIIHQFQTISSVASVAWHVRYKEYFRVHGAPNLHAPTGINKGQVFYEKKEVPVYVPPMPDLDDVNVDIPVKLKTPRRGYKYGSSSGRKEKRANSLNATSVNDNSNDSSVKRERSNSSHEVGCENIKCERSNENSKDVAKSIQKKESSHGSDKKRFKISTSDSQADAKKDAKNSLENKRSEEKHKHEKSSHHSKHNLKHSDKRKKHNHSSSEKRKESSDRHRHDKPKSSEGSVKRKHSDTEGLLSLKKLKENSAESNYLNKVSLVHDTTNSIQESGIINENETTNADHKLNNGGINEKVHSDANENTTYQQCRYLSPNESKVNTFPCSTASILTPSSSPVSNNIDSIPVTSLSDNTERIAKPKLVKKIKNKTLKREEKPQNFDLLGDIMAKMSNQ